MREKEFYRATPRKLLALYKVHKEVNGIKSADEEIGYIDDIL